MSSDSQQQQALTNDADNLCQRFNLTIQSLSHDATALRQISSLISLLETEDSSFSSSRVPRSRLAELESFVSSLESKTQTLSEILREEESALTEMETILSQAERQGTILESLMKITHINAVVGDGKENDNAVSISSADSEQQKQQQAEGRLDAKDVDKLTKERTTHRRPRRRDSVDPRTVVTPAFSSSEHPPPPPPIQLLRVSQDEFQSVPKEIRGRLSRAIVDEALTELEDFVKKKAAILAHNKRKKHLLTWNKESKHDDDRLLISEQELRQSCAFFRTGESTARAVLLVLRTLNRLKQIPPKNGDVVYVIP